MSTLRAGWALWSKKPGSREDYSVLACSSSPFTRPEFATIITRFTAGTPDTRSSGPGALPWVTLSWAGLDDRLQLGIAITDATGHVDGVGRPITQTSYFCVPYADVTKEKPGFLALYQAVAGIALPTADGEMISLAVPQTPATADPAEAVIRFGEAHTATTAALLLQGPVSVVQAEGTTLEERLQFIDAVASLLPFGYRTRLSAATWSDSGTRNRLRFAFAARPRGGAEAVAWRRSRDIPGGDIAREYFDQLCRLRGMRSDTDRVFKLSVILAHMAADTTPRKFEQSRAAVDHLLEIDLPFRLEKALARGIPVDLADLRKVFRQERLAELEPEGRVRLLEGLSAQGRASDWPTLARWLGDAPDTEMTQTILRTFGRRILWTEKPDIDVIRDCWKTAARSGTEDEMLAHLLLLPPEGPNGLDLAVRCAASLLVEIVLENSAPYPRTRQALAEAPYTEAAILSALTDLVPAAERCLNWLRPAAPQVMTESFGIAFAIIPGEMTQSAMTELASLGPYCVVALLHVAAVTGRLGVVLPACARWVASTEEPADPRVVSYLQSLSLSDPRQAAWLDMTLLAAGEFPSALPWPSGEPASKPYMKDLEGIWRGLSGTHALFDSNQCARILARYLRSQHWTETEEQAAAVADLVTVLREHDKDQVLHASVTTGLMAAPEAAEWKFARKWLDSVRPDEPKIALANAPRGADPGQLAALCLLAYQKKVEAREALSRLGKSGAIDSVDVAVQMMGRLEEEFSRAGVSRQATDDWLFSYTEEIVSGTFGEGIAREVRARMSPMARQNVRYFLNLDLTLALERRQGRYEMAEDEREWITDLRNDLNLVLSQSRTGIFSRLLRRSRD